MTRRFASLAGLFGVALLAGSGAAGTAPATKPAPSTPAKQQVAKPTVQVLKNRLDLREPFNVARGKVRIVAFFSPTCGHCAANAQSLMLDVLAKIDSPDIQVDVLWLKVLDTDDRKAVDRAMTLLPDRRVRHYWDPDRVLNAQLLDAIQFDIQLRLYNVVLLYDRNSMWDKRLPRPGYWMQEFHGAPGPTWDGPTFRTEVVKGLENKPLDTPEPQ